jgi:hypothetical protein
MPDPTNDLDLPAGCMTAVCIAGVVAAFLLVTAIVWSLTRL